MQTDGWPEMDEEPKPDMINEEDLLQAKALLLNWIKDLRAQPEVDDSNLSHHTSNAKTKSFNAFYSFSKAFGPESRWRSSWRTCSRPGAGAASPTW